NGDVRDAFIAKLADRTLRVANTARDLHDRVRGLWSVVAVECALHAFDHFIGMLVADAEDQCLLWTGRVEVVLGELIADDLIELAIDHAAVELVDLEVELVG